MSTVFPNKKAFLYLFKTMDQQQIPQPVPYNPQSIPVNIPNNAPKTPDQDQKIKFLEKIISIAIGLNLLVVIIFIGILIAILLFGSDLRKFLGRQDKQAQASPSSSTRPIAKPKNPIDKSVQHIFITGQGLDLDKTFSIPSDGLKLTVNGQLKKEVFGFLPYWVVSKSDEINVNLFTAISYFGLEVDGDGNIVKFDASGNIIEPWLTFQSDPKLDQFIKKARRNRTKIFVTLKCFDQSNIVKLVTNPKAIENFVSNALFLMNSKSLDGLNIDFEYIGEPDQKVTDGFSVLVTALNKEMKRQYPKAKLTIDTFVDAASATRIHDVEILAKNSDGLVIMGYDFHTPDSLSAGPIAPMEGAGINLSGFMNSYLEKVPPDKLILAVPYYGYDWPVIQNPQSSQAVGGTTDVKIYSYAEIVDSNRNAQINWNDNAQTPWYTYTDPQTKQLREVHFENTRSLAVKYDFINQKKLLGVGIWSLGLDGKRTELLQLLADKFAN